MSRSSARRVFISGTGAVSCLGEGVEALWSRSERGDSGLRGGLGAVPGAGAAGDPALEFARRSLNEALRGAGWSGLGPHDGFILATTTGQIRQWDHSYYELLRGRLPVSDFRRDFLNQPLGHVLDLLRAELGHTGPSHVLSSACSAGTQAVALGAMWVQSGLVKRCLVGGVEVLCDLTLEGFRSLQLLSPEMSRPFDIARRGINLSEGAAFLCLESSCAKPLAAVSGWGFSSDAHHMTGPQPEGDGSFRALHQALVTASLAPSDISWIHCHGTGSQQNDSTESAALNRLFEGRSPAASSTKAIHGHALGASGALESVLVAEALRRQISLGTAGLETVDPAIAIPIAREARSASLAHVLKNTLGFGGNNAALVLSRADA